MTLTIVEEARAAMKRTIVLVTALVLVMTGFMASTAAAAPAWTQKDRTFVRLVRQYDSWFQASSARALVAAGHEVCDNLNDGIKESDQIGMLIGVGLTKHRAIVLTSAAITVYCPQHGGDNTRA